MTTRGRWQQTYMGGRFWPLTPHVRDVNVRDIAHALSLQCRFGGHCARHYSVAEHSLYVAERVALLATPTARFDGDLDDVQAFVQLVLAGLLHDASEAYVVDVPRPLKSALAGYAEIERGVMRAITEAVGLSADAFDHALVKRADEELLVTEARDLMREPPEPWEWRAPVKPARGSIGVGPSAPCMSEVEEVFLRTAELLLVARLATTAGHARKACRSALAMTAEITGPMAWDDDADGGA